MLVLAGDPCTLAHSFQGLNKIPPDVLHAFQAAAESNQIVLDPILCPLLWPLPSTRQQSAHLPCTCSSHNLYRHPPVV